MQLAPPHTGSPAPFGPGNPQRVQKESGKSTIIFKIITFLLQKHFKMVTVTVILGKLIQMISKMVIGNQWKML